MGGKTSTSTSQVSIPPEVLARYNAVNANAEKVAQTPFQEYSNNPNAFVAPLNQEQITGMQNTNNFAGAAQPFYGAAAGMTMAGAGPTNVGNVSGQDIGQYMNPYVQGVVNPAAQLLNQQQQAQMSGQTGQAMQQGAFGGDRSGLAAANLAGQQSLAFSNAINPLYSQGYTQALGAAQQQQGVQLGQQQQNLARMGQAGQQIAGIGTAAQGAGLQGAQAQMAAGQIGQQTQQAGLSALYNQFQQEQSYPFQTAQFLANIAEGTGALSGSTTTTQTPQSFFSDERVKDDIEDIGRTHDGQKIVKFRYKGDKGPKQIGLIAQDVEKHHPDAVGEYHGIKTVDYDKATKDAASMGGAVQPQHAGLGFAGGGLVSDVDMNALAAAQQQMWAGNGKPMMGGMPGGGKGLNFPAPGHVGSLVVAKPVSGPQKSGLQQAASDLSGTAQGVKDAGTIKDAWDKYNKPAPSAGPTSDADLQKMDAEQSNNTPVPLPTARPEGLGTAADDGAAQGGYIHRADGGGADGEDTPEDVYQSHGGLKIPNDTSHGQLKTGNTAPASSTNSGLGDLSKIAQLGQAAYKGANAIGTGASQLGSLLSGSGEAATAAGAVGDAAGLGAAAGEGAAAAGSSIEELLPLLLMARGGAIEDRHHRYSGGLVDGRRHFDGSDGSSVVDDSLPIDDGSQYADQSIILPKDSPARVLSLAKEVLAKRENDAAPAAVTEDTPQLQAAFDAFMPQKPNMGMGERREFNPVPVGGLNPIAPGKMESPAAVAATPDAGLVPDAPAPSADPKSLPPASFATVPPAGLVPSSESTPTTTPKSPPPASFATVPPAGLMPPSETTPTPAKVNAGFDRTATQSPQDLTLNLIAKREGRINDARWDRNHFRTGFGSDTVTLPDGTSRPVTEGTRVTAEEAQRDLVRRSTLSAGQVQKATGSDAWNSLTPQAQAALTSLTYNYGHVPSSVAAAARTGDPKAIADAVAGLQNDNDGVNRDRRLEEASLIDPSRSYTPKKSLGDQYAASRQMSALNPAGTAPSQEQGNTNAASGLGQVASSNQGDTGVFGGLGKAADDLGNWYDRNQNWMVPIMKGLGAMASSNSRYLGSALLRGMGAGAGAYEDVQSQIQNRALQEPIVTQRNIATSNQLLGGQQAYNAQTGQNISLPDYAKMVGYKGIVPNIPPVSNVAPLPAGQSGQTFSYSAPEFDSAVIDRNGVKVPARNDGAYLTAFIQKNAPFAANNPFIAGKVAAAKATLTDINERHQTYNAAGERINAPGTIENTQEAADAQDLVTTSNQYRANASNFKGSAYRVKQQLSDLEDVYSKFKSGADAPARANLQRLMSIIDSKNDYPSFHNPDAAHYDEAIKGAAKLITDQLASMPSGAPKAELEGLARQIAQPGMTADAVHKIISRAKAAIDYQTDMYNSYDPQASKYNVLKYQIEYEKKHPYNEYAEKVEKETKPAAGSLNQQLTPAQIAARAEIAKRAAAKAQGGQ